MILLRYVSASVLGMALGFGAFAVWASPTTSQAQSGDATSTLETQIHTATQRVQALQAEISQLQSQLTTTSAQKQTLQNAINALNLNIKKLTTGISLTQAEIVQKDSVLGVLSNTIATTTKAETKEESGAAGALRDLDALDRVPLVLELLAGANLSDFFNQTVQIASVQTALQEHIVALGHYKNNLEAAKSMTESARTQLSTLKTGLASQQKGLVIARVAQNQLLTETKNKESNYQSLIAQKKAEETQFESQLNDYQSKLKGVNASQVPTAGPLLAWPLAHIQITQYFGNTPFATANPQIYNNHGHSGVDFAASPGTPIMAAADGIVMGTGNTDLTAPYASFGKWVFIKHPSGLGTLYAHLGTIGVSQGQSVSQDQIIGYSDTTGYATGPHLHFGVYVASAVRIQQLPTAARQLIIPVAPLSAYLNPLSYLPR